MNVCMLALMVLVPSHSVPISGAHCAQSGYTKSWDTLLHRVAVAKDDTRFGLHEGAPKFGLTANEKDWISKVTGRVICPGDKETKGALSSGSLIGRNDLILTTAHSFRNRDGSARSDWPSCYFETQSQPPVRRKLLLDSTTIYGTTKPQSEQDLDYTLVRLAEPILGVEPIPIAADAGGIKEGQELIVISAHQDSMKKERKLLANEPIIQRCSAREILPADERSGVATYSDCSSTGGASGSILLKRDDSNRLVGVGVLNRSAKRSLDGAPYDGTPSKGNYSLQLMFDGPLLKDLSRSIGVQSAL